MSKIGPAARLIFSPKANDTLHWDFRFCVKCQVRSQGVQKMASFKLEIINIPLIWDKKMFWTSSPFWTRSNFTNFAPFRKILAVAPHIDVIAARD